MKRQLSLAFPEEEAASRGSRAFADPAFTDNRSAPIHRWVPWIAGFSGSFVDSVLATYLNGRRGRGRVLDPFAGVGTTLVQAAIRGHDVVGFEINPYAALAARAKLATLLARPSKFDGIIEAMASDARNWRSNGDTAFAIPVGFRSRIPFFSPKVECQVLHALAFISRIQNKEVRELCQVAFGSVMVSFSNYTYEPSLSSRPGAGKSLIDDADVAMTLLGKLRQIRRDMAWLHAHVDADRFGNGRVYNEDFFDQNQRVETGSIDVMVTSPPYLNNYHYARNTRPQMYWLGLIASPKEQKKLETRNFGTFWQIAREKQSVSLNFLHDDLEDVLAKLREIHPEKGQYGGRGWANYAATYFNDCERFVAAIRRVLRRNGVGVIVVGNSILQGINIRVQDILADIAQMHRLNLDGIHCIRKKRVGNSITASSVRGGVSDATLDESVVVVRKR